MPTRELLEWLVAHPEVREIIIDIDQAKELLAELPPREPTS